LADQKYVGRDDDLAQSWIDVSKAIGFDPENENHLMGLVYNGPHQDWLWTATFERRGGIAFSPEG
jgi:hypothetical protein